MALAVGTDSYATVDHANAWHLRSPYGATWATLETDRKEQLLRWATRLMDENFLWLGSPTDENQPLAWPRFAIVSRQGAEILENQIPTEIADACSEFALHLHSENLTENQALADLKIRQAGDTQFGPGIRRKVVPAVVVDLVPRIWYRRVRGYGLGSVPVRRV